MSILSSNGEKGAAVEGVDERSGGPNNGVDDLFAHGLTPLGVTPL